MNGVQKGIKVGAICFAVVLIVSIFSWCFTALSWLTNINFIGTKEEMTFEENYQNIENLEIDAISSSIFITTGTEFKVEAKNIGKNFSSKAKGTTLKIEEESIWFQKQSGTITITIPIGVILKELNIDTGAGKFEIKNIQANEFDMNHGAGLLEINNSTFQEADIDGGAGEIKVISSSFQTLELDAGVGKVELEAEITNRGKIECGVGELDLTLLGNKEDYSIHSEKGVGTIQIEQVDQQNNTTYGTGSRKIQLEGGVGSIKVSFEK